MSETKQKMALVLGTLPSVNDVDQFSLIANRFDLTVVSAESITGFLAQNSYFNDLTCVGLPDYDENPSYLPGLEGILAGFDVVVVKGRLGMYAFQCVKAKWKHRFRLMVWNDNLATFPGQDVTELRVIRTEVTNAADGFIVQSRAAATVLELEGVSADRIAYFKPYVAINHEVRDATKRAEMRQELGIAESDFVISHTGQVEWEEGLQELVGAIKRITIERPQLGERIRFLSCGIGSFSGGLRDLFISYGIDDRSVYIRPERISSEAIHQVTDLFFVNTIASRDRIDGDPYRVVEAMTYGLPILAPRTPLVEELCGKHRIDFCNGSIQSLVGAIVRADSAPQLRQDIVRKNQNAVAKRFSAEAVRQGMIEAFERLSGLSTKVEENSLDHLVKEAEVRANNKQYLDAIDIIESAFKQPDIPVHHKANLYRLVGDCFAKLGDNEAAKDAYIKSAELDPYSAKTYIGLGTIGLVKNSFDIAVLHFQKGITLAPEDEMANLGLGLAFQGMNERSEAKRWVLKSLSINSQNTAALFTLVKLSHEMGQYDEAIKALESYIQLHPNDYNMIYTLAGLYHKVGSYQKCLDEVNKLTEVDPKDSKAHGLARQAKLALESSQAKA